MKFNTEGRCLVLNQKKKNSSKQDEICLRLFILFSGEENLRFISESANLISSV